jgi:nucleotide-binding universal stress UspA family protein
MKHDKRRRLLVPLDGSLPGEQPLEIAVAVSDLINAEIHVLYVSHAPMHEEAVAHSLRIPAGWLPRVKLHHAVGHQAEAIRAAARDLHADALLMSSHGRTRDLRVPAGHVTLDVLGDPPCPVYVVRSALGTASQSHRFRHLRRILVPLDGSPEAVPSAEHAATLAAEHGARLIVLHVVAEEPQARRAPAPMSYADQAQYESEAWEDEFVRTAFARYARRPTESIEVALRCGDPGHEIARFAGEEDCDLIVAAWGGRISAGRARVVQTLLEQAPCPLLFLRARSVEDHHADRVATAQAR